MMDRCVDVHYLYGDCNNGQLLFSSIKSKLIYSWEVEGDHMKQNRFIFGLNDLTIREYLGEDGIAKEGSDGDLGDFIREIR